MYIVERIDGQEAKCTGLEYWNKGSGDASAVATSFKEFCEGAMPKKKKIIK